jgi:hypothetical protein
MLFARGFILQEIKKILKTVGLLVGGNKKIVHGPYVFAGPMRSALPTPFGLNGHTVRRVFAVGHVDNVDTELIPQPVGVWTMWTTVWP